MPPKAKTAAKTPGPLFERFQQRARLSQGETARIGDFVLGAADGFDPEIVVKFPLSIDAAEEFTSAVRAGDSFSLVRAVFGDVQYARIKAVFDRYGDGRQGIELLVGLALILQDHVFGQGAADVPGGPQPS